MSELTVIRTNGKVGKKTLSGDGRSEIQKIVGGPIDVIYLSDGKVMAVNEGSKMNGSEPNPAATQFAADVIPAGEFISGVAVVCERNILNGGL